MGVRISNSPQPVDRCRLHFSGDMEDGGEESYGPVRNYDRWSQHVNLWCPRSSLGRRACKQRGCCAKLPMLEEMES